MKWICLGIDLTEIKQLCVLLVADDVSVGATYLTF